MEKADSIYQGLVVQYICYISGNYGDLCQCKDLSEFQEVKVLAGGLSQPMS